MKYYILTLTIVIFFNSCSNQPEVTFSCMPKTELIESTFDELPNWDKQDYKKALVSFKNSCKTKKTQKIYSDICVKAQNISNFKEFFTKEFKAYKIVSTLKEDSGLLTGYYEASLNGSRLRHGKFIYPVYERPDDLVVVDLSSIYPELKNYRLRGRISNGKLVPYYKRSEANSKALNAKTICYVDSKIDLFFLEVQGSGRVTLDNGETIYVGFSNQNGYRYSSIGKYLVKNGEIKEKEVSLQSIKSWLLNNPSRVDEVLNHNNSMIFFKQRQTAASGSLGLSLTPNRSIAVDKSYIPLGSMLYLSSTIGNQPINKIVMAEDTGGAIKGAVRADMFLGFGNDAMSKAGKLKSKLKLWIFMPKDEGSN